MLTVKDSEGDSKSVCYYCSIGEEGLRKTKKSLNMESQYPFPTFKLGTSGTELYYVTAALT
jgi:hypothetical protein